MSLPLGDVYRPKLNNLVSIGVVRTEAEAELTTPLFLHPNNSGLYLRINIFKRLLGYIHGQH